MGEIIRNFMPFGEWRPDLRYLQNDGLRVADGVVPVYGNYISSPALSRISAEISLTGSIATGMHVDPFTGTAYVGMHTAVGAGDIFSITESGVITNVSKAAGVYIDADYVSGWQGCNFGQNVVMCAHKSGAGEVVQYLAPGAAAFADMITSTFAPRARFCFPLNQNLFLANLTLSAGYDTLSAGANPTVVAWSRNDNIRQFGSSNANPEIIGADYQPLNFDIGDINGAVAGPGFGIVAHSTGIVRVDGPPYSFRVQTRSFGTLYPNSLCVAGRDVYFFAAGGLARMREGFGEPELLGAGKFIRSLIDNATGFWDHAANFGTQYTIDVSIAHDPVNNLMFIAYTPVDGILASGVLVYNIDEDRSSYFTLSQNTSQIRFVRAGKQNSGTWLPGRDIRFLEHVGSGVSGAKYYGKMALGNNLVGSTLQRGYVQFSTKQAQRLLRIRPVYHVSDQAAIEQISVTIESTNKPYATPIVKGPYTAMSPTGWIVTPDSVFADFHSPKFTMAANANMYKVVEIKGFEYEVELGPQHAA